MSHLSPSSILLWAILSTLLLVFLVWHLWKFDKFQCLTWGSESGGFKRIMTYSYLCSVPLLMFYSVTLATIKYHEGFLNGAKVVTSLPYNLWDESSQHLIVALYVALSVSWALEIVSHLEELNFWLFLMALKAPQNWLGSSYFYFWGFGSLAALVGLPVTAIVTRHDPLKSEAWIFFVGSVGGLLITVASLRVLWLFPQFIKNMKAQGADSETIVRLHTYSELNNIRVLFRFLFVLPLFVLAIDGIRPGHHHEVNQSFFATDLLAMISGVGCVVSSALTLLVFFPRSIAHESGYMVALSPPHHDPTHDGFAMTPGSRYSGTLSEMTRSPKPAQGHMRFLSYGSYGSRTYDDPPTMSMSLALEQAFQQQADPEKEAIPDRGVASRTTNNEGKGYDIELKSLEDIGYDEMQARGTRYNDVRRATHASGGVHPYVSVSRRPYHY